MSIWAPSSPSPDPRSWPAFRPVDEADRDGEWRRSRHECVTCGVHTYVSPFVAAVGCCLNCGHGRLRPVTDTTSDH